MAKDASDYELHKRRVAKNDTADSLAGRDVGAIAPIKDVARRGDCRHSLRRFCETYNPETFSMGWSADHLRVIARIEEAATLGALYAFAMPRGSGKSTICRLATLWALSYSHCRYVFLIGANAEKAEDSLAAIKIYMRFLPEYAADFPEISQAVIHLAGIANKAAGQLCLGQSTMIGWGKDRIILPTVPPPPNWLPSWPLRADGMVPTSGAVAVGAGLTSDGIRGSAMTLTTGETIRPDLVLIDDPQSAESAHSRTQNVTREQLVSADVLGMAGPGKTISAVMPCTIIAPGDMVDRLLDRSKHPLWRGERTGILDRLPANLAEWEPYFDLYRRCAQLEPPDFTEANRYYVQKQEVLDAGCVASWQHRKLDTEVSAIQHAMNLYCRDRRAFMAEYMNQPDPIDLAGQLEPLDAGDISRKVNGVPRGVVPASAVKLTVGIDVGQSMLFWVVAAWSSAFDGSVVDYGVFPKQNRRYFAAREANPSLADEWPDLNEESRIFAGLKRAVSAIVGRSYQRQGGGEIDVDLCFVDSGKWTKTVYQFCRQSEHRRILRPSKGWGSVTNPMDGWSKKHEDETKGDNWRDRPNTESGYGRLILIEVNHWKSFVARGLLAPEMGSGCIQLFGDDPDEHRLFADHCTAEVRTVPLKRTTGDQREVEVWKPRVGGPDNHYWEPPMPKPARKSRSLAKAMAKRGGPKVIDTGELR
jgi:hypothetical protein